MDEDSSQQQREGSADAPIMPEVAPSRSPLQSPVMQCTPDPPPLRSKQLSAASMSIQSESAARMRPPPALASPQREPMVPMRVRSGEAVGGPPPPPPPPPSAPPLPTSTPDDPPLQGATPEEPPLPSAPLPPPPPGSNLVAADAAAKSVVFGSAEALLAGKAGRKHTQRRLDSAMQIEFSRGYGRVALVMYLIPCIVFLLAISQLSDFWTLVRKDLCKDPAGPGLGEDTAWVPNACTDKAAALEVAANSSIMVYRGQIDWSSVIQLLWAYNTTRLPDTRVSASAYVTVGTKQQRLNWTDFSQIGCTGGDTVPPYYTWWHPPTHFMEWFLPQYRDSVGCEVKLLPETGTYLRRGSRLPRSDVDKVSISLVVQFEGYPADGIDINSTVPEIDCVEKLERLIQSYMAAGVGGCVLVHLLYTIICFTQSAETIAPAAWYSFFASALSIIPLVHLTMAGFPGSLNFESAMLMANVADPAMFWMLVLIVRRYVTTDTSRVSSWWGVMPVLVIAVYTTLEVIAVVDSTRPPGPSSGPSLSDIWWDDLAYKNKEPERDGSSVSFVCALIRAVLCVLWFGVFSMLATWKCHLRERDYAHFKGQVQLHRCVTHYCIAQSILFLFEAGTRLACVPFTGGPQIQYTLAITLLSNGVLVATRPAFYKRTSGLIPPSFSEIWMNREWTAQEVRELHHRPGAMSSYVTIEAEEEDAFMAIQLRSPPTDARDYTIRIEPTQSEMVTGVKACLHLTALMFLSILNLAVAMFGVMVSPVTFIVLSLIPQTNVSELPCFGVFAFSRCSLGSLYYLLRIAPEKQVVFVPKLAGSGVRHTVGCCVYALYSSCWLMPTCFLCWFILWPEVLIRVLQGDGCTHDPSRSVAGAAVIWCRSMAVSFLGYTEASRSRFFSPPTSVTDGAAAHVFNLATCCTCVQLAGSTYDTSFCVTDGDSGLCQVNAVDTGDEYVVLAHEAGRHTLYVAIRGTKTTQNKVDDVTLLREVLDEEHESDLFDCCCTCLSAKAHVHQGFKQTCDRLEPKLVPMLLEAIEKMVPVRVVVTGHSLGAAVAQLLAYRLVRKHGFDKNRVFLYTFGAPLTGTSAFRDVMARYVPHHWNVVYKNDAITRLSLTVGNEQAGNHVQLCDNQFCVKPQSSAALASFVWKWNVSMGYNPVVCVRAAFNHKVVRYQSCLECMSGYYTYVNTASHRSYLHETQLRRLSVGHELRSNQKFWVDEQLPRTWFLRVLGMPGFLLPCLLCTARRPAVLRIGQSHSARAPEESCRVIACVPGGYVTRSVVIVEEGTGRRSPRAFLSGISGGAVSGFGSRAPSRWTRVSSEGRQTSSAGGSPLFPEVPRPPKARLDFVLSEVGGSCCGGKNKARFEQVSAPERTPLLDQVIVAKA